MMYIIPSTEVRKNIAAVIAKIRKEGSPCFITKNGRSVAALLPMDAYNRLVGEMEDRLDETDEHLSREVQAAQEDIRAGRYKTPDKIRWE